MKKNKINLLVAPFLREGSLPVLNTHISTTTKYTIFLNRSYSSSSSASDNKNNRNNNVNWLRNSLFNTQNLWVCTAIVSLLFLIIIYYMSLREESYIIFIITFYISFLVSLFIFNNNKYSELFIIRLNQIFAVNLLKVLIFLTVVLYILYYFNIIIQIFADGSDTVDVSNLNIGTSNNSSDNSTLPQNASLGKGDEYVKKDEVIVTSKAVVDKTAEVISQALTNKLGLFVENIATAAGAGSAAGAVGAKIIGGMGNTPVVLIFILKLRIKRKRIAAGAAAATLTAGGVSGAIKAVSAIYNNNSRKNSKDLLANTSNSDINNTNINNSPMEEFIHSVIESSENTSPLENLLDCEILFGGLILISLSFIIIILCLWVYNKYNIILIKYILGTNLGYKIMGKFVNMNFIKNMNDRFFLSLIVINIIVLIFCILFQLYISVELRINLLDYIEVHNQIKKSGLLFITNYSSINRTLKKLLIKKL